jgi:hypothetical protein
MPASPSIITCKTGEELVDGECLVKCLDGQTRVAKICTNPIIPINSAIITASVPTPITASVPTPITASVPTPITASVPTLITASVPTPITASVPTSVTTTSRAGFCYPDPNNPSYYLLKTKNESGWKSGQSCWATDGTITGWNQKPCYGGDEERCNSTIGDDGNVIFPYISIFGANGNLISPYIRKQYISSPTEHHTIKAKTVFPLATVKYTGKLIRADYELSFHDQNWGGLCSRVGLNIQSIDRTIGKYIYQENMVHSSSYITKSGTTIFDPPFDLVTGWDIGVLLDTPYPGCEGWVKDIKITLYIQQNP